MARLWESHERIMRWMAGLDEVFQRQGQCFPGSSGFLVSSVPENLPAFK